jgi:hypothetical protein
MTAIIHLLPCYLGSFGTRNSRGILKDRNFIENVHLAPIWNVGI